MYTIGNIEANYIQKAYHADNIKIKTYGNSNRCYIFFSSHALYYPNTQEVFEKVIVEDDRYEWEHLAMSSEIVNISGKHIFLRDIYKQWYVEGVNSCLNTLDKVLEYLSEITHGYEVITVGNSAGGYVAAIAADYLDAIACYNFAGQVSLVDIVEKNELLSLAKEDTDKRKYFSIEKMIHCSKCCHYYFYAKRNNEDCQAYQVIAGFENVKGFGFNQKIHGVSMFTENMIPILCYSDKDMDKLSKIYGNRMINRWEFLFRTTSLKKIICVIQRRSSRRSK